MCCHRSGVRNIVANVKFFSLPICKEAASPAAACFGLSFVPCGLGDCRAIATLLHYRSAAAPFTASCLYIKRNFGIVPGKPAFIASFVLWIHGRFKGQFPCVFTLLLRERHDFLLLLLTLLQRCAAWGGLLL